MTTYEQIFSITSKYRDNVTLHNAITQTIDQIVTGVEGILRNPDRPKADLPSGYTSPEDFITHFLQKAADSTPHNFNEPQLHDDLTKISGLIVAHFDENKANSFTTPWLSEIPKTFVATEA